MSKRKMMVMSQTFGKPKPITPLQQALRDSAVPIGEDGVHLVSTKPSPDGVSGEALAVAQSILDLCSVDPGSGYTIELDICEAAALIEAYATTREQKARVDALEEAAVIAETTVEAHVGEQGEYNAYAVESAKAIRKIKQTNGDKAANDNGKEAA